MKKEHLANMIFNSADRFSDSTAMRYKTKGAWHDISYREMGDRIRAVAHALLEAGIQKGDMVGIFSQNRHEWTLADFGILSAGGVSVPIYATNTLEQAEYIIKDSNIRLLFTGDQDQYDKAYQIFNTSNRLEKIISFDNKVHLQGDRSYYFSDFISPPDGTEKSAELEKRLAGCDPDNIATLVYTSGTTGEPKGVMLTHSNFLHQTAALKANIDLGPGDRSLCFLPLSHVFERTWSFCVFKNGVTNNYLSNPKETIAYMQEISPNVMVSVPRLYEKVYSTVHNRIGQASVIKKSLFKWAVSTGKKVAFMRKQGLTVKPFLRAAHSLADTLVLKKLRSIVGSDKKFFGAGGAALSKEIEEFFFAIGILVCQGYGLTESSPTITCNTPDAFKFGTVGKPLPLCDVKIAETGEVLARGPNIMTGYYNKPNATKEALSDGWFRTGDVGEIDTDGYLRITGRIKDLIVLSTGKNIAPQRIETAVGSDHYIDQVAVIGDSRKYVTALIVPSFEALEEYTKGKGIQWSTHKELVTMPEIISFYKERIASQSTELAGYETIKKFHVLSQEFTQETGELTPTLKIKRDAVKEKYQKEIEAMYADR